MRTHLLLAAVLLLGPAALSAQAAPPARVARDFFRLLEQERWSEAAALVHPDRAAGEKRSRVRLLSEIEERQARPFDPRTMDPAMPEPVARYLARRDSLARTHFDPVADEFARVRSVEEMRALPAAELMARHLEALDGRAGCAELTGRSYPEPLVTRTVLGEVAEGEWVHVVFREHHTNLRRSAPGIYAREVKVLPLRRSPEGWRIADVGPVRAGAVCDPVEVAAPPQT
ncbi:MAG TPA: hypothetical protein VHG51_17045 [Longimicrobiaceae bacterium]|nr:hypothetical protein [Longimicrobiaceae bacterium]